MPIFDYDYSNKDYELIGSNQPIENLSIYDYVRLTIYTITPNGRVSDNLFRYTNENGDSVKAVFYSSIDNNFLSDINVGPFFNDTSNLKLKALGGGDESNNDFKLYRNPNNSFYVKPNEIFNKFDFPEGNYRVKVDILSQVKPTNITEEYLAESILPLPQYFEEYDANSDGIINVDDINIWNGLGRPDISTKIAEMIVSGEFPNSATEEYTQGTDFFSNTQNFVGYHYQFSIKQVSTSRREVRLKLLNLPITRDSYVLSDLKNHFTDNSDTYKFGHFLNIGDGKHIPITNYHFDDVTDGKNNQSIILRLYKPLPRTVGKLKQVSIEKEKIITQYTDVFYFSDIQPGRIGDGLQSDDLENWINTIDNDSLNYQNYNNLTSSLSEIKFNQLLSGSIHDYPNLNTDFRFFKNHTFFGSAKKKLENFKTKVETIQGHYSTISQSLFNSGSNVDGDSDIIVKQRKDLFNKINEEIKSFTPYEKFLYFDGQNESTASAPGIGKNYADVIPISDGINVNTGNKFSHKYQGQINGGDGFDVVYHHSSQDIGGSHGAHQFIGLFTNKYYVHNKPFFNYSSSIYLSFLMKGDSGSAVNWENRQHSYPNDGGDVKFPQDTKFRENILNPNMTGSAYQRYVFHTSHSYWVPRTLNNDTAQVNNFKAGSTELAVVSGSVKTGSSPIRDSSGKYQNYSTVVTQSGVPFTGAIMPAGELFRIFTKNNLSSSLLGYYDYQGVTIDNNDFEVFDKSGNSNTLQFAGTGKSFTSASITTGVQGGDAFAITFSGSLQGTSGEMFLSTNGANAAIEAAGASISMSAVAGDDVTGFTMATYYKSTSPKTNTTIMSMDIKSGSTNVDGWSIQRLTDSIAGEVTREGVNIIDATTADDGLRTGTLTPRDGNFHHIAMTYDNLTGTGSIFFDGVLQKQGNSRGFITGSNSIFRLIVGTGPGSAQGFSDATFDETRFYTRALTPSEINQLYLHPDGKTDTKITDVKITLNNPTNAQPFSELYHTSSAEWQNWYNGTYDSASIFDRDNIHSLENNLPTYIQESSQYGDLKDFLSLQGEQYDVIKNHIDSLGTINDRGYQELNSPPKNIYPILLNNLGYEAINPFEGNLTETLASYLTSVTSIDDIKNNTFRKILNNLIYVYKSKGTKNSVRGLLNIYGYPPDVIPMREFNSSIESSKDFISEDEPDSLDSDSHSDTDLDNQTGDVRYSETTNKLFNYSFQNNSDRTLNLDWYMDNANINTIQFVYKHVNTTQTQTILESSGSGAQTLWDLRLIPSSDGISSSFEFRLNNSNTGSLPIATNAVSMSTSYVNINNGELWNVMLQRMTSSISGSGTNTYKLHAALQKGNKISPYKLAKMSVSGGIVNSYVTGGDVMTGSVHGRGYFANQNWLSSGSRASSNNGNLFVGKIFSGSLGEIRGWSTALSASKFRQHTLNKFSTTGNTIDSHRKELVYHFKLNENYTSGSISSSTQAPYIVDAAPKTTLTTDYSFSIPLNIITGSLLYGFDYTSTFELGFQDNNFDSKNDNSIRINPKQNIIGNLNPFIKSTADTEKPLFRNSNKLELDVSPTNRVNQFIINKLDGFNLEKYYGKPLHYFSQSYNELDTFRQDFYKSYPIEIDVNKFIRAHENMFNPSIAEGVKTLVPARSTLSDRNSGFGVTIKPTILEKQKYEHHQHSVEVNPNTFTSSISIVENTEYKQKSLIASLELPYSTSLSLGNSYLTNSDYVHSPFLQSNGVTGSLEFAKSGSALVVSESILFKTTQISFPHSSSLSLGNSYQTESVSGVNVLSTFLQSTGYTASLVLPFSVTIDEITTNENKSFVNIHDSWGTSSSDTHFINFAGGTGSEGNYNVGHIDTRNVFHMIGDTEYFSSSFGKSSDFGNSTRFYNRTQVTEDLKSGIEYDSEGFGRGAGIVAGRMMGKTRYFKTSSDGTIETLPSNHVSKFANNFKDTMYAGTQNTNPGFFPKTSPDDKSVDFSTSSFYGVKVTGGENQIIIKSNTSPTIGSDDTTNY